LITSNIKSTLVIPFGSYVTKLYLPNADIDIVVLSKEIDSHGLLTRCGKLILALKKEYVNV